MIGWGRRRAAEPPSERYPCSTAILQMLMSRLRSATRELCIQIHGYERFDVTAKCPRQAPKADLKICFSTLCRALSGEFIARSRKCRAMTCFVTRGGPKMREAPDDPAPAATW